MTHEQARELILDLAYGELAPAEAREVERHAAECAECGAAWRRIAEARRLAGRVAEEAVPTRGRDEIVAAARRAVAGRGRRSRAPSRRLTWAVATAAVAMVVVGVTLRVSDVRTKGGGAEETYASMKSVSPSASRPPEEHSQAKDSAAGAAAPPSPAAAAPETPAAAPARRERAKSRPGAGGHAAADVPRLAQAPAPAPQSSASSEQPTREESGGAPRTALDEPWPPPLSPTPSPPSGEREANRKSAAPPAAMARRQDAAPSAPASVGASRALVEEIERRRAGGGLAERARHLTCRGAPLERVALVDGAGRVVKLTVREADGTVREGWYDEDGRLREARARRGGAEADDAKLPQRDPMRAFDAPCPP